MKTFEALRTLILKDPGANFQNKTISVWDSPLSSSDLWFGQKKLQFHLEEVRGSVIDLLNGPQGFQPTTSLYLVFSLFLEPIEVVQDKSLFDCASAKSRSEFLVAQSYGETRFLGLFPLFLAVS
jgi:hypothetical protein